MLWVVWFHGVTTALSGSLSTFSRINDGSFEDSLGRRVQRQWWAVSIAMTGDGGVDFFFVLSGFLLGGQLVTELATAGRVKALRFYVRRWFRIEPGYASAMLVQMAFIVNDRGPRSCPALWWSNLAFMNNIWPEQNLMFGPACMTHTWSIAVEFQMYLLTPPLLILAHYVSRRLCLQTTPVYLAFLSAGVLGCCVLRWLEVRDRVAASRFYGQADYLSTLQRSAPYLCGVAAAIAVKQYTAAPYAFPGRRVRAIATIVSWLVLLVSALVGAEPLYFQQHAGVGAAYRGAYNGAILAVHAIVGRPLVGLATAYLLTTAITGHAPRLAAFLSLPLWRPFAVLSYSIYLLQYVGGLLWTPLWELALAPLVDLQRTPLWIGVLLVHSKFVVVLVGTLPLALLNYTLVERPMLRLGHAVADFLSDRLDSPAMPPKAHALL